MGGQIGVESTLGYGSKFWFEVPMLRATNPTVSRRALPQTLNGLRALIVDDIEMNQRVMARQLDAFGIKCVTVDDGFRALGEIERAWHNGDAFDVVILDHTMPGISGETLARRIRETPTIADTKLVMASSAGSYGLPADIHMIVDAVLNKPIREQSLLDAFARLFGKIGQSDPTIRPESVLPAQIPSRPLRVLLAEDQKINQRLATMLLHQAGHHVDVAENGEKAVAAMQTTDYDIVLMDVQMPVLDGVQATKQIRALPAPKGTIPIIALTAHAMAGAREEYLAAGMDDYLSKPLDPTTLFAALSRLARPSVAAFSREAVEPCETDKEAIVDKSPEDGIAIFDRARVATLRQILSAGELVEFVHMFLESLGPIANRIQERKPGQEVDGLRQEAHALVGTAGNVGASRLRHWAQQLELACEERNAAAVDQAASAVGQVLPQTRLTLSGWLDEQKIDAALTDAGTEQ
jgi:CheY-like chemotaxis protein/HPt (histidine-containing phosphotransfer) domain-containing protein